MNPIDSTAALRTSSFTSLTCLKKKKKAQNEKVIVAIMSIHKTYSYGIHFLVGMLNHNKHYVLHKPDFKL